MISCKSLQKTNDLAARPLSVRPIRYAAGVSLSKVIAALASPVGIVTTRQSLDIAEIISPSNINGSNLVGTQGAARTRAGSTTPEALSRLATPRPVRLAAIWPITRHARLVTFLALVSVFLFFVTLIGLAASANAQSLTINTVTNPPIQVGSAQGKRAIWLNGGSVAGTTVDIVAVLKNATRNHTF
jgi:hypothetical protein